MALTEDQRVVCQLIAANRLRSGESYVAGGTALNTITSSPRLSNDIDLFHDSEEALEATWLADRTLFETSGYRVDVLRSRPGMMVEAAVTRNGASVRLQWVRDSAFRFFPLVTHPDFGLTLHPVDLATNKLLAVVGRVEARDWIDIMNCDGHIQPLGYLAWAASGKDPGFSPSAILSEAARTCRYSRIELAQLAFEKNPPDIETLSATWRSLLAAAHGVINVLPAAEAGTCVLTRDGQLCRAAASELPTLVRNDSLLFHSGRIRGAYPMLSPVKAPL
jgi:hypothetical protein